MPGSGLLYIKVKSRDIFGAESDWATLEVSMPKQKIFNRLNIKGKPRLFEYLFFLSLFLAAIYSSFVTSAFYIENMSVEVIKNSWSFVVYYGFSLAFGWYHYIEKLDE